MQMERDADPQEYDRALEGVDFPASRDAIVNAARDKGGLDSEVIFILGELPANGSYDSRADLDTAIERVYARRGGLEGDGPAAPAAGRRADPAAGAPAASGPDYDATQVTPQRQAGS